MMMHRTFRTHRSFRTRGSIMMVAMLALAIVGLLFVQSLQALTQRHRAKDVQRMSNQIQELLEMGKNRLAAKLRLDATYSGETSLFVLPRSWDSQGKVSETWRAKMRWERADGDGHSPWQISIQFPFETTSETKVIWNEELPSS